MTREQVKKITIYWRKTAKRDYDTMMGLFKIKRYPESLFYGHIVLEKILKALVVQSTKKESPYSHHLLWLMQKARIEIELQEKEKELLGKVNEFNIRARYPDYKLQFYKKATKIYTEEYLRAIKKLYKKLCLILQQKQAK